VIPLRYNMRSLMVRRTTSLMAMLGVALVVLVLFILTGFIAGLQSTVMAAASRGVWIVLSRGVTSEPASYLTREQFNIIRTRGEIAEDSSGKGLISPEFVTGFFADPDKPYAQNQFTFLRGVYPIAYSVHPNFRVVSGRLPNPGQSEMVVGRKLAARAPNLVPGRQIHFGRRMWKIVGIFSDQNSARESEVWTDLDVLEQDVRYAHGFASLRVVLRPGMEESFKHALSNDSRLVADAEPETEFYSRESEFADQLRGFGLLIVLILGIGASFGGMNTMYAAVARRVREIGVLRTLGFSRRTVMLSFILESMMLALAGGVVGEALGVLVAVSTGLDSRLMNVGMFIFSFNLTAGAFGPPLIAAAVIGAVGGLLPALRAARMTVTESIRAV
jgi:putative ABC transport system permease protein